VCHLTGKASAEAQHSGTSCVGPAHLQHACRSVTVLRLQVRIVREKLTGKIMAMKKLQKAGSCCTLLCCAVSCMQVRA
jgi:hypothetical protein